MDTRIKSLLKSLERNHHRHKETFIDEDTGEEVSVDRDEIVDFDITEEERELMESIIADVAHLSDEDLKTFRASTIWFWPRKFDEFYLELIRRGDEEAAFFIEDPAILQELCDKGNKWAAWELYFKNRYGDEENGIFINKREAREYYDLALKLGYELDEDGSDAWDDRDDPGEEYPEEFCYTLTGNAQTLDGVETLIRDLCKRFGIPENEEDDLGLFVPQRMLMKVLVGSDTEYYRGNIQYLERETPDRLVITTEADSGEPLLYALRQCFENLKIEMKSEE
jgi:hypothetical protein